jgi:hypothetical protein
MEFNLRFLDPESRTCLQHAIDGVNKAGTLHDPGAWNFVSAGGLIQANNKKASERDPIAVTVFEEMEQDGHSGYTASWTITTVTEVAKNYRKWRTDVLRHSLEQMRKDLDSFIQRRFAEKFPEEGGLEWSVKREKVLHDLEYSYLVQYVLDEQDRNVLQFLLKMENVSHLGNEVVFDQIEEHLKLLPLTASPEPCAHRVP